MAPINANVQFVGEVTQIAAVVSVVAGLALIGGGVAFYVGKKLRGQ